VALLERSDKIRTAEYRAKAVDAFERAAKAKAGDVRTSWEHIAESYHDLAERMERKPPGK